MKSVSVLGLHAREATRLCGDQEGGSLGVGECSALIKRCLPIACARNLHRAKEKSLMMKVKQHMQLCIGRVHCLRVSKFLLLVRVFDSVQICAHLFV